MNKLNKHNNTNVNNHNSNAVEDLVLVNNTNSNHNKPTVLLLLPQLPLTEPSHGQTKVSSLVYSQPF